MALAAAPKGTRRFNEWAEEMIAVASAPRFIRDVHQTRDGTMVFGTMTPKAMAELLFVSDWTITDQDSPSPDKRGYQRPIKSERLPRIGHYIETEYDAGTLRMPPVILSVRHVPPAERETFVDCLRGDAIERIHEQWGPRAVCIVDGQHRTGGGFWAAIDRGDDFNIEIPVVMYYDLTYETEAAWFNTINSEAQPIPKSLLEWTKLDITEAKSDSIEQKIRRITERLATERSAPFEDEVNMAGGRSMGRHITFEGLRRSVADFFGGPKAKVYERLVANELDPYDFIRDYWRDVAAACSEAWNADPAGGVKYRIKELVAIAALAKLGNFLTEQAMIQGKEGPAIRRFVSDKATKLSAVDWTKSEDNPWMRSQAGFAGQIPLFETLKEWIFLNKKPG